VLSEEHFDYRSPGHGVPPAHSHLLLGKKLVRDIDALTSITEEDVA